MGLLILTYLKAEQTQPTPKRCHTTRLQYLLCNLWVAGQRLWESPQCLALITHIKHVSRSVLGYSLNFSARGTYPFSSLMKVTVGANEMTHLEVFHQFNTWTNSNSESWLLPMVFFLLLSCHLKVNAVWHIQKEATYILPPRCSKRGPDRFCKLSICPMLGCFSVDIVSKITILWEEQGIFLHWLT